MKTPGGSAVSPSGGGGPKAVYGWSSMLPVLKGPCWCSSLTMSRTCLLVALRGCSKGMPDACENTSGANGGSSLCWGKELVFANRGCVKIAGIVFACNGSHAYGGLQ